MPSGRVWKEGEDRDYKIIHGGNFPKAIGEECGAKRLVGLFGLSNLMVTGHVSVEMSEKAGMSKEHKQRLRKLIGKIPY
jgi:hypothetical protein